MVVRGTTRASAGKGGVGSHGVDHAPIEAPGIRIVAGYATTGGSIFCPDSRSGGLEEPDAGPETGTGES